MYACESKVVTPSKVDPNCVPTSVVVEKPTGEFGVNLDATGGPTFVAADTALLDPPASRIKVLPVASCKTLLGD